MYILFVNNIYVRRLNLQQPCFDGGCPDIVTMPREIRIAINNAAPTTTTTTTIDRLYSPPQLNSSTAEKTRTPRAVDWNRPENVRLRVLPDYRVMYYRVWFRVEKTTSQGRISFVRRLLFVRSLLCILYY